MNNILGTGFITITDLSDPIISSTEPPSPVEDMLWMDISITPPILKIFKNGEWVAVSEVGDTIPDNVPVGGYFTGDFEINKQYNGTQSKGKIRVLSGNFIHINGNKYEIVGNKTISTSLTENNGKSGYVMFIGSDSSRFSFSDSNTSKQFIVATYTNKKWCYYNNGVSVDFDLNDNDCIVAKIEECTSSDSDTGIKRIIKYFENEDSVFEAITGGGQIQGIYKKDGMLFINATYIATGKLISTNRAAEFDLDKGTFRLGGTGDNNYSLKFDGKDLHFSDGAIKWDNLDSDSKDNLRNVVVSINGGIRNVSVNANNVIQTEPTAYTAVVHLGSEDITSSCSFYWTASGIYKGNSSGSVFIPSKGNYTTDESYIQVVVSYKNAEFAEKIGISVSKEGQQGATGDSGDDGVSITNVDVEYAIHTSATTAPTSGWQTTAPTWVDGKYIWSRTKTAYSDGRTTYSQPACITGGKGQTGNTGNDGKGITSIVEQYYSSTSQTSLTGGSWSTAVPAWTQGRYIWTRSVITYTDNTTTTTSAVCVSGSKGDTGATGATGPQGPTGATGNGIKTITEYYLLSSLETGITVNDSGWSTTVPTMTSSKRFLWCYELITYTNGTSTKTQPKVIGAYGNTGATGNGIKTITNYYLATNSSSGVTTSTSGWTTSIQTVTSSKRYLWNYEVVTYTNGNTNTTTPVIIGVYGDTGATGPQGPQGPAGATGATGPQGISITKVDVEYAIHTSATTAPTSGWQTTAPTWVDGKYIWSRTVTTYSSGGSTTSQPACITGGKGATGATGTGITSITEYYLLSSLETGITVNDSGWSTTVPTMTSSKRFLWCYELIRYTNGTSTKTEPKVIGAYGNTGATGNGIKTITNYYLATSSSSGVTTSTSGWTTSIQTVTSSKRYLWNYEVVTYTNGNTNTTTPVIIGVYGDTGATGATGPQGPTGATGTGITSITEEYYLSTSKTTQTGGSWTTTPPTWSPGKYIWTRSKIVYNNPTSTVYTTPVCDSSWEAVNEIQIGGRNLVRNSDVLDNKFSTAGGYAGQRTVVTDTDAKCGKHLEFKCTTEGSGPHTAIFNKTTNKIGKVYTWSFWAKASVAKTGNVGHECGGQRQISLTTSWQKFTHTWTFTDSAYYSFTWYLGWKVGEILYVRDFKIEEGNKATDWTPSPEDTDEAIGNSVKSVETMYYLSTSATSQTGGSWSTTMPASASGKFIWMKTRTTLVNGTVKETAPVLYQPDWIQDWGGTKTEIGGTSVLAPKIFAGTKESNGTATGVAVGTNIFGSGSNYSGIAGYRQGVRTFHFKTDGSLLIGANTSGSHISWDGSNLSIRANSMSISGTSVATTANVTNAVNNIFVGGRNLLRYSDFASNNTSDGWDAFGGTTGTGLFGTTYKYNKNSNTSGYMDIIRQTIYIPNSTTKYMKPNTWYTFSFYAKGSGKIKTHIYPSIINTSIKGICNGSEETLAADGNRDWTLTSSWQRFTYTFKSATSAPTANNMVLFRLYYGNEVYICAPQLEEGNKVSEWTPAPEDVAVDATKKANDAKSSAISAAASDAQSKANAAQSAAISAAASDATKKANDAKTAAITEAVGVRDTRNTNENPQWYFSNYPRRTVQEFKYGTSIGIPGAASGKYGVLETKVPWNDSTGGYPTQKFTSENTDTYYRSGTSTTAWGSWSRKAYATQTDVFNSLTNNGAEQGIYLSNNKVYLNAEYIKTGYIGADRLAANSISVSKLAIGDLTNYCELTKETASALGWNVVADSSQSNNPWFSPKTLNRDISLNLNGGYEVFKGSVAGTYRISFEVSSTVRGATSNGGSTQDYMNINIGLYCKTKTGANSWNIPTGVKSDSNGTVRSWTGTVKLPDDIVSFGVYCQIAGWSPFSGTLKIRNIKVMKMMSGELVVDGAINGHTITGGTFITTTTEGGYTHKTTIKNSLIQCEGLNNGEVQYGLNVKPNQIYFFENAGTGTNRATYTVNSIDMRRRDGSTPLRINVSSSDGFDNVLGLSTKIQGRLKVEGYTDLAGAWVAEDFGVTGHADLGSAYISGSLRLNGESHLKSTFIWGQPAMTYKELNGYPGMALMGESDGGWIRTTQNGLIPYQSGGHGSVGTSSWQFNSIYGKAIYENGTALTSKYVRTDTASTIMSGGNALYIKANADGKATYIVGRHTDNTNKWYVGAPNANYNLHLRSVDGFVSLRGAHVSCRNSGDDAYVQINATKFNVASEEKWKENVKRYSGSAIDKILGTTIYDYTLKNEDKSSIGLVIDRGVPNEIVSEVSSSDNNSSDASAANFKNSEEETDKCIDLYAMCTLSWKAIQEQQQIIRRLEEEIESLKKQI